MFRNDRQTAAAGEEVERKIRGRSFTFLKEGRGCKDEEQKDKRRAGVKLHSQRR